LEIDSINIKLETGILECLQDPDFINETLKFVTESNNILEKRYLENEYFETKNFEKIHFYYDVTEIELQNTVRELKKRNIEYHDSQEKIKHEESDLKTQDTPIQKPLKLSA